MRKFNARWWSGEDFRQWKMMVEAGDYFHPFAFYPAIHWDDPSIFINGVMVTQVTCKIAA